ncbi:MAG: MFS transporter [SAR202 cluster bacterium]|nr:MFS transporter [SAR202 cluster bacterium]MDP7105088.1 MFS transporter [SAR202 cluster bacterium]MDP7225220.1 MFS transporter [SAR202 cluster bacterium]MDP7412570.1 MFS transporter [SAR202 cluster bacterium]MDP7534193.1 MFS transporter [SAR202 cluster bacterium]
MANIKTILRWTPRTPIYYGWVVLGMVALGTYAGTGAAQIVIAGVQNLIFEDLGWDRTTIAFAVTAGTWTSALLTPFAGRLADRHGPRWVMPLAAVVVGICYFSIASVRSVWQFYASYIVARGIGNPNLVGVVPRTVTVNFFQRRRNLALGLTSTFRPISNAVNIQVIAAIASFLSWRAAYRYLGSLSIILALPLILIMRRRPEDIGLLPDGDTTTPAHERPADPGPQAANAPIEGGWTVGQAAATRTFWFIVVAEMLTILTAGTVTFQIVPFLVDSDVTQGVAVTALSLSTLFGALVNPAWGFLADRHSAQRLAIFAMTTSCAITVFFLVLGNGLPLFFVALAWGTASGGLNILSSMMLAQYFGRASFGAITGLMGPFQIGALGLGPAFGAVLFSATGGYTVIWVYGVTGYAVAALLIFATRRPTQPESAGAGSEV